MIVFAVITSVTGLSLGLFVLFPLVITAILLMGYSKITALLTTVGSICVGLMGTTYSVSSIEVLNSYLELSPSSELLTKLIILVVGLVLLIFNVLRHAKKHKNEEFMRFFLRFTPKYI